MTAYFISGLGADKRMFQNLELPEGIHIVHLEWQNPIKGESVFSYCQRLAKNIDTKEEFLLIGLSFGGIIATELSQIIHPKETIIISSVGSRRELPWFFRLVGKLRIYQILSPALIKTPTSFTYWLFGAKSKAEKHLLRQTLKDTPSQFLSWAINTILNWKRDEKPKGIYHIHGMRDRLLPIKFTKPDVIVEEGGHLMVLNKACEISKILSLKLATNDVRPAKERLK